MLYSMYKYIYIPLLLSLTLLVVLQELVFKLDLGFSRFFLMRKFAHTKCVTLRYQLQQKKTEDMM